MKSLFTLIILALSFISQAQVPEKMSYQAVIRDVGNNLVVNQTVGIQISILQSSPTGVVVYTEVQSPQTNNNGLTTMEIGTGQVISGSFSSIDWGNGPYYLKTETDITGGTNYTISGTTQLLSVPYALYAKSAGEVCPEDSMGIYSEVEDPMVPPTVGLAGTPGVVDNRYYKYKYLYKKNDARTLLSPESSSIQVIDNTVDGQIDFSVQVPNEQDIDSIVVYRQFSIDNTVFGLYSLVESFPVVPGQTFNFTDNYDNFTVTPNPQPLPDTNNTFIKGIIKTDLLTEDREYQLPDESGTIALQENIRSFNGFSGNNEMISAWSVLLAQVTINSTDLSELITQSIAFDQPVYIQSLGVNLGTSICSNCTLTGTVAGGCGYSAYTATGNVVGYRILVGGQIIFDSSFSSSMATINTQFEQGCTVEIDYTYQRTNIPVQLSTSCLDSVSINLGIFGELPTENIIYIGQ